MIYITQQPSCPVTDIAGIIPANSDRRTASTRRTFNFRVDLYSRDKLHFASREQRGLITEQPRPAGFMSLGWINFRVDLHSRNGIHLASRGHPRG